MVNSVITTAVYLPVAFAGDEGLRAFAHDGPDVLMIEHVGERARHACRVVCREKHTGLVVIDQFAVAAHIGRRHDPPLRHCFERFEWRHEIGQPAFLAREGEHIGQRIVIRDLLVRHAPGEDNRIAGGRGGGLRTQSLVIGPAAHQQQFRVAVALAQQWQRGNQIVEALIRVEAADEADHGALCQAKLAGQRFVACSGLPELREIHGVGRNADLLGRESAPDKIAAQPLADREHCIDAFDDKVLQGARQAVLGGPFGAGPIADRRILPEGAGFVHHRDAELLPGADRREPAQRGRMGMQHVGAPVFRQSHDGIGMARNFAPFGEQRRATSRSCATMKMQAFAGFFGRSLGGVARAGNPAHIQPVGQLRAHDRLGAKGIAAVERQRMVEDMEYAHGVNVRSAGVLNAASTPRC